MVTVRFDAFRCFSQGSDIDIRPITFLVGENSAGKTSFLAGLRFLFESLSRRSQNSFNREPYFLGGFDQIAHYRGGRGGRAKEFMLSITVPSRRNRSQARVATTRNSDVVHEFTFTKGFPQPELSSYSFKCNIATITLSFSEEVAGLRIRLVDMPRDISFPLKRTIPSVFFRENPSYISNLIDDIRFQMDMPQETPDQDSVRKLLKDRASEFTEIWHIFRETRIAISQEVFASAPVRTQPLRTYTPSELIPSSEGSHVPLELARTKIQSPEEWKDMKRRLTEFGVKSGMFSDLDIRRLGKSDVDPFQILIKINGPSMNLVDVGYGVSQILPIVYQLQNTSRHSTFLLQQPEIHLHPRAQAELGSLLVSCVNKVTTSSPRHQPPALFVVETHSDYIIDRVRIEIANGAIRPEHATIVFFERHLSSSTATNLYFNDQGDIEDAPPNFRTFFMEEHARILGIA